CHLCVRRLLSRAWGDRGRLEPVGSEVRQSHHLRVPGGVGGQSHHRVISRHPIEWFVPISSGDRLGPYVIVSPLAEGGLGAGWKSRDTRLDRTVAIKVSKADFSERIERE